MSTENNSAAQNVEKLLDGLRSLSSSTAFFDLNNDGISELSGWIAPTEGMLVYDKNSNGLIDSNLEMFGKIDKDGFTELKEGRAA